MVACLANTFGNVELAAEWADFTADSVFIEEVTFGAFEALLFVPCLAPIVIGDGDELREWNFATLFVEAAEISIERGEGEIALS